MLAFAGVTAAAAGIYNLIKAGIKAVSGISRRKATREYLEQYMEAIKTAVKDCVTNIQKGISDGLKGLKPLMDKKNMYSLKKIKAKYGKA